MTEDPFRILGLTRSATPAEVRSARRDLARQHHPDVGGDPVAMQRINAAAAASLKVLAEPPGPTPPAPMAPDASTSSSTKGSEWVAVTRDIPSFTVEALPVEAFEALLLATKHLGEVEDDDPPYELCTLLWAPLDCWCQLNIVPDAGSSTVSISIAAAEGQPLPLLVDVRNAWINALNELDWSAL